MSTFITKNQGGKSKPKNSSSTSSKSTSSTKQTSSSTKSTAKPIDYTFDSRKETAEQYNARIAKERGDSAKELESMQKVTAETFKKSGLSSTSIPKAQVPTNVANIPTPIASPKIPDLTPDTGDIANAVAGMDGLSTYAQKKLAIEQNRAKLEMAREEERQKENQTLWERIFGKKGEKLVSPGEARKNAWDETGLDVEDYFAKQEAGIKEIESLSKQYNQVVASKDQQIAATQDKMGSMNFINNQTAQIERNAAPQLNRLSADINAKAATLQAEQGNFAEAQRYVNQAVADASADAKFNYDMFATFYEINQDAFDRTEKIYDDAFKNSMAIAEAEYERVYAEKRDVAELMLKYPSAGVNMTDSFEDAVFKSSQVAGIDNSGSDLTADMKNYLFAKQEGYEGTFADFTGKGGDTSGDVETYATGLFNGDIVVTNIPEKYRAAALKRANEMATAALAAGETAGSSESSPGIFESLFGGATNRNGSW